MLILNLLICTLMYQHNSTLMYQQAWVVFVRFSAINTNSLKILQRPVTEDLYSTIRNETLSINNNTGTACKEHRFYFKAWNVGSFESLFGPLPAHR